MEMERGIKIQREMRMEREVDWVKKRYSSSFKEITKSMSETITHCLERRPGPCRMCKTRWCIKMFRDAYLTILNTPFLFLSVYCDCLSRQESFVRFLSIRCNCRLLHLWDGGNFYTIRDRKSRLEPIEVGIGLASSSVSFSLPDSNGPKFYSSHFWISLFS